MINRLSNFLHIYGYKFTSNKPVIIDPEIPCEGGVLIENSQLPNKTKEILIGRGIKTLDDLVNTDKELIKTYRGIGNVSMKDIEGFLVSNNLKYPEIRIERIEK